MKKINGFLNQFFVCFFPLHFFAQFAFPLLLFLGVFSFAFSQACVSVNVYGPPRTYSVFEEVVSVILLKSLDRGTIYFDG